MIRIGAVSYLNTRPLIYGLQQRLGSSGELTLALPSVLADDLQAGRLDVALIPSVEYFRGTDYRVVSNAAIACRGPVWSVRLLSRVPVPNIRRLALDEGSRTSAAMLKVLLWEMYSLTPETVPLPIDCAAESVDADAILMIGDRAMHPERSLPRDLGLGGPMVPLDRTAICFRNVGGAELLSIARCLGSNGSRAIGEYSGNLSR